MAVNEAVRERAIEILHSPSMHPDLEVYKAVIDLRRNPKRGDESLLTPLLYHHDAMVVAATLYALTHIYGNVEEYRDLIMELARGDPRDYMEMPLQSEAIECLAELAEAGDREALTLLWRLAESKSTSECPRARAWYCLARLAGDNWSFDEYDKYSEVMIMCPESEEAEQIRHEVREAAKKKGIYIKPE